MSRFLESSYRLSDNPPLRDYRSPATRLVKAAPKAKKQKIRATKAQLQEQVAMLKMIGAYQQASKAPKPRAKKPTKAQQQQLEYAHLLTQLQQQAGGPATAPAKRKYNTKPKPQQQQQQQPYYNDPNELALYNDDYSDESETTEEDLN
jgi:hypothetical protein